MDFSDQFIKILNAIAEKVGITVDWATVNIMPYIQDLLARIVAYEIATSIFWIFLGAIVTIGGILMVRLGMNSDNSDYDFIVICGTIIIIASVIVIGIQIHDIITAIYVPETIYLDYFNQFKDTIK